MARGFYSLVQYCPDRSRAEAVNVGLVLLCLDPHAVRVRMTSNHRRVQKLFSIARPGLEDLKISTNGLLSRIENSKDELRTSDDLAAFAATRANDLRLTEPRLAKLKDIDEDFERLYTELVEDRTTRALADQFPAEILPPAIGEVFHRLSQQRRIWDPAPIMVPMLKRRLDAPYAYRNGVINLVKPQVFNPGKRTETLAAKLAIEGDLISKHAIAGEKHRLIIVSTQENEQQSREITENIEPLFKEYNVRLIRLREAESFAREVEETAH
jgi:hypothetical protein